MAILKRKKSPNILLVDDSPVGDDSTILLSKEKLDELNLFSGDYVLLKGKKRKATVAVVGEDEDVDINKVKMSKVVRQNLRYRHI